MRPNKDGMVARVMIDNKRVARVSLVPVTRDAENNNVLMLDPVDRRRREAPQESAGPISHHASENRRPGSAPAEVAKNSRSERPSGTPKFRRPPLEKSRTFERCVSIEAMPNPADHRQFHRHHYAGDNQRQPEIRNQKRQRVSDAAQRRHQSRRRTAHQRLPSPGQRSIVRQRLRETHRDPRAHRRRQPHAERIVGFRASQTPPRTMEPASSTDPSIKPARPG